MQKLVNHKIIICCNLGRYNSHKSLFFLNRFLLLYIIKRLKKDQNDKNWAAKWVGYLNKRVFGKLAYIDWRCLSHLHLVWRLVGVKNRINVQDSNLREKKLRWLDLTLLTLKFWKILRVKTYPSLDFIN